MSIIDGPNKGDLIVPSQYTKKHNPSPVNNSTITNFFSLNFTPTHDFILVEKLYVHQTSEGIIQVPDEVTNKQQTCRVLKTGPGGMMPNGSINHCCCKEGDLVFLTPRAPGQEFQKFEVDGRVFHIIHDSNVLGIFDQPSTETVTSNT